MGFFLRTNQADSCDSKPSQLIHYRSGTVGAAADPGRITATVGAKLALRL
jgi:hypothetical protein